MNTSPKTARLLALAAALAVAFWAVDRAFAAKSFSELSGTEMRTTLEDAYLADDSYGESATVRDGYKPTGAFMSSKNIEIKGKDANGNPIFTFKNLDSFETYAGRKDRIMDKIFSRKPAPCAYTFDAKTGMISPLSGDAARSAGFNPNPPNFNAQVLEKDGTTHIAFRGSGASTDDWVDTNTGQMVGGLPPQFELADKLVESVQDTGSGPVRLSGHSEGAGEVQYATLGSLLRGKNDVFGSAFNYQQLSGNVRDIFPPEVLEKAKDHLLYVRIGNDPVSGLPLIGVGALGEEYTLDNAEWKGGDGKDDGLVGSTKEFILWNIKGVTDRGEAHRMGNVLVAIQGEIGEKLKYERMSFSEQQQYHLDRCLNRLSEIEEEMAKYEGRNLTPEEQAAYDELKERYEHELYLKDYLEDSVKDAKEAEAEEAAKKKAEEEAKKKAEEEAQKKAEEEAAKKAAEEGGVDENGNQITGAEPPEDPNKQDWTPFEDDEEPQEGDSPFGDGYNPFEDDGKEPEEGEEEGEEGGEEESFEPEEETDEFEPGQKPETEDEDEPYPPEEDEEQEPYKPEEDEEAEPYEPEEDEEQEPSEPEEDEEQEPYEPEENEEPEATEPEENEEPEPSEPEENEEPEPSEPEENEEPEPSEPEENEEPEPTEPEENEEPEPSEPEENEEPEPAEPEEEEEPEPAEPEEEEPEPTEPEEGEEPEPYESEEEEESYEPPSSLRDEPKLDPDNEHYEPYDPNSAFRSWLDWNNQVSINKGNESQMLNQYITHEREQESKNTIAQQNADDTRNQGGEAAQTTSSLSASSAANAQSENSWTTHLSDAIQESIEAGLTEAGGTFGRTAGEQLASNLFDKNKNKDKNKGGGGGGSGGGGGGGGRGGDHGDGESGHEGGGGHGGDGGGGGGGGHGHDHGEGEGEGEGGDGGCSEGDSGDYDDGTGGDYDDGTGGGYDDGTGGGYDDGTGGGYDDGTGGGYDDGTGGGYDDHDSGGGYDDGGGYDGGGGHDSGGRITFNTPGSYTVRSRLEPVEPEPVAKEEPQEAKSSGCPGPVHHGCGGCVYEGEWDDDKGGRFWICDKCGHKDHWGPWLE